MFLQESELKEMFWSNYGKRQQIITYQFENTARQGGIDLVTVEKFLDRFEICAFEFKLADIKKALAQAKANLKFVHKSFIVVPAEKKQVILDKYSAQLKEHKYIGVMSIEESGRWEMIYQPKAQQDVIFSQEIMRLLFIEK